MDFSTIKSLLWTFSPFLISYIYRNLTSLRTQLSQNKPSIRPVPAHISPILSVLALTASILVLLSLPLFAPENIYLATDSRLPSTSPDLLFRRLAQLRPHATLTPLDESLKARFASHEQRALYLLFGPWVLTQCTFCTPEEPGTYLLYALPALVGPHLLNMLLLGLSTSAGISGREGARWRLHTTLAGTGLLLLEVGLHYRAPYKANLQVFYAEQLVFYFARFRMLRVLGLAVLDAGFAAVLWATSTNRLFVLPYTASERVGHVGQALEMARVKMSAVAVVRNASLRGEGLRARGEEYWRKEGSVMGEVMTSEEVSRAVGLAIGQGRLDLGKIEAEAGWYAASLIQTAG